MKKSNRLTAMLIVLALVLTLFAACSGNSGSESTENAASTENVASTASGENASSTQAANDGGSAPEPIVLTLATSYSENELSAKTLAWFCDYVEEHSNGAVEFKRYFGGQLGSASEELGLLQSGAIDICSLQVTRYTNELPLADMPNWALGGIEGSLDVSYNVFFENQEVKALLDAELANYNAVYLGGMQAGSPHVIVSKKPITTLAEAKELVLGVGASQEFFTAIGFKNLVTSAIPDSYENLSRGLIEGAFGAFSPAITLMWYEQVSCYLFTGVATAGNQFIMNMDSFNALSPELQALFREASLAAQEYSLELNMQEFNNGLAKLDEAGVTYASAPEDEQLEYISSFYELQGQTYLERAASLGIEDEQRLIIKAITDYMGFEWNG